MEKFIADIVNNKFKHPDHAKWISAIILFFLFLYAKDFSKTQIGNLIWFFSFFFMCYATFKIWRGISTYQCPKCEKIYVSEVTSSKHLGSEEQKQRFKAQDEIKNNKNERVGLIEREETGVVRTDYFENKAKCNRCGYKWSFKSSNSDRVG